VNSKIDKVYFEIFKKHFPDLKSEEVKALFEGNDHWVFVVKDKTFRFPKAPREIDPKRATFLKKFASSSPLPLPLIEIYRDEETGINYEINDFIHGISFYHDIAETFNKEELLAVAQKLGEFLSSVHAFPIDEARKLNVDEMNPTDFWAYMEQNENAYPKFKREIFPYISDNEQKWIEKLFTDYISMIKEEPFKTMVIHSDMWVYHIIVDPKKHALSGVIDFGPRIADPANDFKAFEYYGSEFVKEVYKNYSLPVDENFEKRRLFYTGHDEVFELARQVERGNQERITDQKTSLSDYIADHPFK